MSCARSVGFAASILAALLTVLFDVFLVLDEQWVYYTACLFLSWSVVVMIVSMRAYTPPARMVLADCASAFAVMYAILVSTVYYTQLAAVLRGGLSPEQLRIVADRPGTVFFYIDMYGYCFLCLATLFMAALVGWKQRWLFTLLVVHGLIVFPTFLVPFLPGIPGGTDVQAANTAGVLVLVAWGAIFAPICVLMARYFLRAELPSVATPRVASRR